MNLTGLHVDGHKVAVRGQYYGNFQSFGLLCLCNLITSFLFTELEIGDPERPYVNFCF